jgi:trigger factor
MAGPPKKPAAPVRGRPLTTTSGKSDNRDARTVSLEAGRTLQRTLDAAPNARVAVKVEVSASSTLAEKALAAAAGITLNIAALPIGRDLLDRRLQELRKLISITEPRVGSPVVDGDEIEVDILGYIDGKVFLAQQAAWLEVRPNVFLPGLIEGFVGMTAPESAVFQLKMPAHYPAQELRGKVAAFAVTLRQARKRILPDLEDPIFVQLTGRKVKTLPELESKILDELAEERGRLCVDEAKVGLLRQLYVAIGVNDDVADVLVDEELRRRWKAALGDAMAFQGVTVEDQKKSLADFSTPAMRAEARRAVWEGVVLEALADAHDIKATEGEVHKLITDLSPDMRRGDVETVLYQQSALSKEIVKNLRLHRALLLLLAKATVNFDATTPSDSRVILAPLPIAGSGAVKAGSGGTKPGGEMTAARGLKRPASRGP